jgi:hypothetical protein
MAYGDHLHGDGDPHQGEPTGSYSTAPSATTDTVLEDHGHSGHTGARSGGGRGGTDSVGTVGQSAQSAGNSVGAELTVRTALRVVDTVLLFNSTHLGRVLNERQLHRHRVRSGRAFVVAPRNKYSGVQVLRYIAWLAEYRHVANPSGPIAGRVNYEGVTRILESQSYRCALTGRQLHPEDASLDHIVPVSRGGQHLLENVQVLHTAVNRAKGALTTAEFVSLCREVAAWADQPRDQEQAHV